MEGIEIARKAVEAATEKQAIDITLLDVSKICSFADYFVICSGESGRQLQAICDEIEHTLKTQGEEPIHHEGTASSGWMLYDYGDVLIPRIWSRRACILPTRRIVESGCPRHQNSVVESFLIFEEEFDFFCRIFRRIRAVNRIILNI